MNAPKQILVPADFRNTSLPVTAADIDKTWRTLYGECSGQSFDCKIATCWTIRNRVTLDLWKDGKADWWGEGFVAICIKKWQFTCWMDHNAERIAIATLGDAAAQECMLATLAVMKGLFPDPTAGATHYFNPKIARTPDWAIGRTPVCAIDGHSFYVGVEPGDPKYTKPKT
ncbi:cell wall hydrolase [Ferrovibrio terrae]|uniref:cell wall hydrolase n=1 Tax=Ferrovibrio terrae TaxID=2594003 RepID=UPI0031378931